LEIHHLVHRIDGGSHDALNLALLCSSCHQAHHSGTLTVTGTAEHLEVRRPAEPNSITMAGAHVGAVAKGNAYVGAPAKPDTAMIRTQAKEALVGLGWKPAIANAGVAAASAALGTEPTLERLIFESLRRCSAGRRRPRVYGSRRPAGRLREAVDLGDAT
jgi:hypothetical protein